MSEPGLLALALHVGKSDARGIQRILLGTGDDLSPRMTAEYGTLDVRGEISANFIAWASTGTLEIRYYGNMETSFACNRADEGIVLEDLPASGTSYTARAESTSPGTHA